MQGSTTRRATWLMLGAVVSFFTVAALIKWVRGHGASTSAVMVWRMAPTVLVLGVVAHRSVFRIPAGRRGALSARLLCGGLAMATGFWAVRDLSLLQHSTFHLLQPMFVAVVAPIWLGERPGTRAYGALGLGAAGAFLIVAPWSDAARDGLGGAPLVASSLAVASALFSGIAHVAVRAAAGPGRAAPLPPTTVAFQFSLWIGAAALAVDPRAATAPPEPVSGALWGAIAALGIAGLIGQVLMSHAYARGAATAVASVAYAGIPLGVVADAWLWARWPTFLDILGTAAVLAAAVLLTRAPHGDGGSDPAGTT